MIHASYSVLDTLFKAIHAKGGISSKLWKDSFLDHQFTYDSTFIRDLEPEVSKSKPGDTPIEWEVQMSEYSYFNITEDNFKLYGDLNFNLYDEDGTMITEINMIMAQIIATITSDPLFARVNGDIHAINFGTSKVTK